MHTVCRLFHMVMETKPCLLLQVISSRARKNRNRAERRDSINAEIAKEAPANLEVIERKKQLKAHNGKEQVKDPGLPPTGPQHKKGKDCKPNFGVNKGPGNNGKFSKEYYKSGSQNQKKFGNDHPGSGSTRGRGRGTSRGNNRQAANNANPRSLSVNAGSRGRGAKTPSATPAPRFNSKTTEAFVASSPAPPTTPTAPTPPLNYVEQAAAASSVWKGAGVTCDLHAVLRGKGINPALILEKSHFKGSTGSINNTNQNTVKSWPLSSGSSDLGPSPSPTMSESVSDEFRMMGPSPVIPPGNTVGRAATPRMGPSPIMPPGNNIGRAATPRTGPSPVMTSFKSTRPPSPTPRMDDSNFTYSGKMKTNRISSYSAFDSNQNHGQDAKFTENIVRSAINAASNELGGYVNTVNSVQSSSQEESHFSSFGIGNGRARMDSSQSTTRSDSVISSGFGSNESPFMPIPNFGSCLSDSIGLTSEYNGENRNTEPQNSVVSDLAARLRPQHSSQHIGMDQAQGIGSTGASSDFGIPTPNIDLTFIDQPSLEMSSGPFHSRASTSDHAIMNPTPIGQSVSDPSMGNRYARNPLPIGTQSQSATYIGRPGNSENRQSYVAPAPPVQGSMFMDQNSHNQMRNYRPPVDNRMHSWSCNDQSMMQASPAEFYEFQTVYTDVSIPPGTTVVARPEIPCFQLFPISGHQTIGPAAIFSPAFNTPVQQMNMGNNMMRESCPAQRAIMPPNHQAQVFVPASCQAQQASYGNQMECSRTQQMDHSSRHQVVPQQQQQAPGMNMHFHSFGNYDTQNSVAQSHGAQNMQQQQQQQQQYFSSQQNFIPQQTDMGDQANIGTSQSMTSPPTPPGQSR